MTRFLNAPHFYAFLCLFPAALASGAPDRTYQSQRWQEDWRASCRMASARPIVDKLKCQPLGSDGLSIGFGGDLRERLDVVSNPNFGLGGTGAEYVWLHRLLVHADVRYQDHARAFLQLGSHVATDRAFTTPATDRDALDVQQGFVDLSIALGPTTKLTMRGGRQELSFGSSRLVSLRDGPNVRRSFDGARVFTETDGMRFDVLAVHPVQLSKAVMDDATDQSSAFWGAYATVTAFLPVGQTAEVYYLGYAKDHATFAAGRADERRHSFGLRYADKAANWDWDIEGVLQRGSFGTADIHAWTVATDVGYQFTDMGWKPRVGVKADIASGDASPGDTTLETFNPLFPKLPYFTEANLVAPANLVDLHPTVSVTPTRPITMTVGWNALWKAEAADAYYAPPMAPVPRTTNGGHFIGHQSHLDMSYAIDPQASLGASYVHFWPGSLVRAAGGAEGDYITLWTALRF